MDPLPNQSCEIILEKYRLEALIEKGGICGSLPRLGFETRFASGNESVAQRIGWRPIHMRLSQASGISWYLQNIETTAGTMVNDQLVHSPARTLSRRSRLSRLH
jgi:hypothetical protein